MESAPPGGALKLATGMLLRRSSWLTAVLLTLVLLAMGTAQPANRAGLVVRFSEDRVKTYCVSFAESEISGHELLQRAGLELEVQEVGMGASVCRVEEVGCAASNCFCQCRGATCEYWSYWQMRDGAWQYAVTGASLNRVSNGEVEGWSWGPGSVSEAISPPLLTFDEVCTAESTAAAADDAVGATTVPDETAEPVAAAPTAGTAGAAQDPGAEEGAPPLELPTSYLVFGLLLAALAALGLAALRGRQR